VGSRKSNPVIDKTAYLILKALAWFSVTVPRNVSFGVGSALGSILWIFLKVEKKRLKITTDNLRILYPHAKQDELLKFARRVCRHFGRFCSEYMRAPVLKRSEFEGRIRFEGLNHFTSACKEGKGVILATAHFGHFEIGAFALSVMGYPVFSVIREVDNIYVDKLFDDIRRTTGLGIIKKENASKEIIRHLRKGDVVTIHTDLHAAFNNIFMKFLGKWASTFITPAVLSLRTGAPVLSMLCFRNDATDSYTIRFYPKVEIKPAGDISADVRQITSQIVGVLENAIHEAPEQWFWLHRRWKEEPDDKELEAIKKQEAMIDSVHDRAGAIAV